MNKIKNYSITLSIIGVLFAGNWVPITTDHPADAKITLQNSDIQSSVLTFNTEGYWLTEVETSEGMAVIIETEEGTPILNATSPDLEKLTTSLIIPDFDEMEVNILSSDYTEYTDIFVAPSKGNLLRTINPDDISYQYGEVYETDGFYPGKLAELRDPYIIRDFRGQTVIAYPFQYNPVQKLLRVYHSITLEVISTGNSGINVKENSFETNIAYRNENEMRIAGLRSSGNYFNIEDYKSLESLMRGEDITESKNIELNIHSFHKFWFILVITLIIEWFLRKQKGLL